MHTPRNFAGTTITSGDLNNTTSPITISVADGSQLGSTWPMWATVDPTGLTPEVVEITARTGDSITITRPSPVAHAGAPAIKCTVAAEYITEIHTALDLKAALAGPTFTGVPHAPTAAGGTNTTQIATTAFVAAAVSAAAFSGARAYNSGVISIPHATLTLLTFDSEDFDTDAYHSTSSNTGRLVAPSDGYYLVGAQISWATNTSGASRYVVLRWTASGGGSTNIIAISQHNQPWPNELVQTVCSPLHMSAGDYVECLVFQDSGGSLNVQAPSTINFGGGAQNCRYTPVFWINRSGS